MYSRLRSLVFRIDPEIAHEALTMFGGHLPTLPGALTLLHRVYRYHDPSLEQEIAGLHFPNPIGLAAGFDKTGRLYPLLSRLGFGFVECGTFTRYAQPGNPRPRIFRYPESGALVNRMGFNNPGAFVARESIRQQTRFVPRGINIGKSKVAKLRDAVADYLYSLDLLAGLGDYVAINVSSPNTPGLRELQGRDALGELLGSIRERMDARDPESPRQPLFVKIAPDLEGDELAEIVEVALATRADGIIISNTTIDRSAVPEAKSEAGGLSGKPLVDRSTAMIRAAYELAGDRLAIIGVGGVFTARDALEKIAAGASLVQVYTGIIYEGPGIAANINRGINRYLADSKQTLADLRGRGHLD